MNARILLIFAAATLFATNAFSQKTVVVHDPTVKGSVDAITNGERSVFDKAMPAVRRLVPKAQCEEPEPEAAGVAHGSFTRAGAKQALIFYQYCQTGNGLGWVGLMLIENGKLAGSWVDESGWSLEIHTIPDINKNGLDEFALAYGGGMHQGQSGVGVDLMEFSGGAPKGLGWYQSEKIDESDTVTVWKLTARPGPSPVFYKQRFTSGDADGAGYVARGKAAVTKLGKAYGSFDKVK
jgi:hypothetical protein